MEYEFVCIILNEMSVIWISGRWDSIIIYDKSKSGHLFADRLKWKMRLLFEDEGGIS